MSLFMRFQGISRFFILLLLNVSPIPPLLSLIITIQPCLSVGCHVYVSMYSLFVCV